ncbi:hypothetical protein C8R47DRAFT_1073470 [Mycena vitilis]|nr:hypothetical protein C8R47DRAFT_1073470 [Mycena vitilis]
MSRSVDRWRFVQRNSNLASFLNDALNRLQSDTCGYLTGFLLRIFRPISSDLIFHRSNLCLNSHWHLKQPKLSVPTSGTTTAALSSKAIPPNSACTGASSHLIRDSFKICDIFLNPWSPLGPAGCPTRIIELPDSSEDVTHLLSALYNRSVSLLFDRESLPFPFIAALIRLGRKYDFENLFRAALKRLSYENPTTLEGYQSLKIDHDDKMRYVPTQTDASPTLTFDTITLPARENCLFTILPYAYLRALFCNEETIFRGIRQANSPPVTLHPSNQQILILASAMGLRDLELPHFESPGGVHRRHSLQDVEVRHVESLHEVSCGSRLFSHDHNNPGALYPLWSVPRATRSRRAEEVVG